MSPKMLADRYEVGEEVGGGGTAVVYKGRDLRLRRDVAIKLFRVDVDAELHRVESELHILASLNHPSLVTLYDAGDDPQAYLVMEFVEGSTLTRSLFEEGPRLWKEAALMGARVADGLAHAHSNGIVHRDVKPSNIILGGQGAMLTDFGVAQLENQVGVTTTGMTVGTAPYLSPEQVQGERATPMSDVYSLGLTLIESITGRRSYEGGGVEAALARLSRDPVIPTNVPEALQDLLREMTDQDAWNRPQATDVSHRLSSMLEDTSKTYVPSVTAPPVVPVSESVPEALPVDDPLEEVVVSETTTTDAPRRRGGGKLLWGWVAFLTLLAGALVATAVWVDQNQDEQAPYVDDPTEVSVPAPYEGPLDRIEELMEP